MLGEFVLAMLTFLDCPSWFGDVSDEQVLLILASFSDRHVSDKAVSIMEKFEIEFKISIASAHRTPARLEKLVNESKAKVIIAVAGLSAALPGAVAALTTRPVIGVPVSGKLNLDSLFSVVQMPPGIPVLAVGLDRGENAAIAAAQILALSDAQIKDRLNSHRAEMAEKVEADSMGLEAE